MNAATPPSRGRGGVLDFAVGAEAFATVAPTKAAYSLATDGGIVAEEQYNTVDDALTFKAEGGLATTLYATQMSAAVDLHPRATPFLEENYILRVMYGVLL